MHPKTKERLAFILNFGEPPSTISSGDVSYGYIIRESMKNFWLGNPLAWIVYVPLFVLTQAVLWSGVFTVTQFIWRLCA